MTVVLMKIIVESEVQAADQTVKQLKEVVM